MKTLKFLIPVAGLLAVLVGALQAVKHQLETAKPGGAGASSEGVRVATVGDTLKDLTLSPLGGGASQSLAEYAKERKAHVVLLNFWATWCSACLTEMPSILKLQDAFASKGFAVVLVTVDDDPDSVAPPFLKKFGISFPTFADRDQTLADQFDVHGIPYTAILKILPSGESKFLYREIGERDWNAKEVHKEMDGWLASQ